MQAPDKIYLHRTTGNNRLNGKVHSYKPAKIRDDDKIIEYIRKNALLEWAKAKHMELDPPQNERDFGRIEAVEELIYKINSL